MELVGSFVNYNIFYGYYQGYFSAITCVHMCAISDLWHGDARTGCWWIQSPLHKHDGQTAESILHCMDDGVRFSFCLYSFLLFMFLFIFWCILCSCMGFEPMTSRCPCLCATNCTINTILAKVRSRMCRVVQSRLVHTTPNIVNHMRDGWAVWHSLAITCLRLNG